jgi:hypothetical protein
MSVQSIMEAARQDALRAEVWATLNGSSVDAMFATDPGTMRIAGDPECRRAMLRFSRDMRDRLTREILSSRHHSDNRA